jgi:hypothetical protein
MKYALLVLGIAVCIGLSHGSVARLYDQATTAALSEEARLAIDVRCRDQDGRGERECRAMLKKLYLSGSVQPLTGGVDCPLESVPQQAASEFSLMPHVKNFPALTWVNVTPFGGVSSPHPPSPQHDRSPLAAMPQE